MVIGYECCAFVGTVFSAEVVSSVEEVSGVEEVLISPTTLTAKSCLLIIALGGEIWHSESKYFVFTDFLVNDLEIKSHVCLVTFALSRLPPSSIIAVYHNRTSM